VVVAADIIVVVAEVRVDYERTILDYFRSLFLPSLIRMGYYRYQRAGLDTLFRLVRLEREAPVEMEQTEETRHFQGRGSQFRRHLEVEVDLWLVP